MMSTKHLQPCINLAVLKQELESLIDKARDWALMHGISMRSKENFNKAQVQVAPFMLLPSSFPKESFEKAKSIQILLNELMHKVAHNNDFIRNTLKSTIEVDDFTAKLFHIYDTVYAEGFMQTISLGLLRSDYLLHNNRNEEIKQVELNTIASSFGGIATVISEYHRYILEELGHADKLDRIPDNRPTTGLSKGLIQAWNLYNDNKAVILFVVEDITYNICDQRFHEFEIQKLNPSIKIIRRNLRSLVFDAELGPNKELIVNGYKVAVVYFRSGYDLEAYPSEKEWEVRLLIERSRAIKCPSIHYHLAGTKKIQQALAQPGVLNTFLNDQESIAKIQDIFTGLYALDFDEKGEKAVEMAIKEPHKYVLKPQREGGGNNVYDEDVRTRLTSMRHSKERTAWILMDRIDPLVQKNYLISSVNEKLLDVISELGIYGVIIGDHKNIMVNEEVGHVLRSKASTENEGGIIAGFGALDSPYLLM